MTNLNSQIKHFIRSYHNSIAGLKTVFHEELAFRQDLLLFILGIILIIIIPVSTIVKLLLYLSLVIILIAELINTAIEKTIDRIGPEQNELSKKAKDIGSAIVFIALVNAALLWFFVFIRYII